MWTLIFIFIGSLLATLGMLLFRVWQIKNGKVAVDPDAPEKMIIPEMTFASLKENVLYYGKRAGHLSVMAAIALWIRGSHEVTKHAKKLRLKVKKNEDGTEEKTPISSFLVTVSEYKKRARKLRERITKEDKENSI